MRPAAALSRVAGPSRQAAASETKLMPERLPVWRIFELRHKGRYIGSVLAADEKEAIDKAIEEFGVSEPPRQRRLVAQREA